MTATLSALKQLPLELLRQPMWFATLASLGLHGLLALLPSEGSLFTRSPQIDTPVEVVELTPEEQAQLPDFVLSPPENDSFDFGAFDDLAQFDNNAPLPTPSDPLPTPSPNPGGSALDDSWLRRYRTGTSSVDPSQLWRRLQQETARQNRNIDRNTGRNTGRSQTRIGTSGDRRTNTTQDDRDTENGTENPENRSASGSTDTGSGSARGDGASSGDSTSDSTSTEGDRSPSVSSAEERQSQLRQGFVYDGTGVDDGRNQVAQSRLTALQAEGGAWSDRLSNERMTDQDGNPESRFWVAVNPEEPLPIPYPAGILSLLDPAPQVLRIAVLVGPEGRPTPETAPEILSSSGYAALDRQAQKSLMAALQDQEASLTERPGYRVYIYWLQFAAVGGDRPPSETPESPNSPHRDSSNNAPGNAPGNTPGNAPGNTPGNAPGNTPGNVPSNAPGNAPGNTPGNAPSNAPGNAPSNAPGNTPNRNSSNHSSNVDPENGDRSDVPNRERSSSAPAAPAGAGDASPSPTTRSNSSPTSDPEATPSPIPASGATPPPN